MGRVVFEPLLEPLALGDVLERAEEARHRAVGLRAAAPNARSPSATCRRASTMRSSHAVAAVAACRAASRLLLAAVAATSSRRDHRRPAAAERLVAPAARSAVANAGFTNVHRSSRSSSKMPIGLSPTSVRHRASRSNTVWSTARTMIPRTSG